MWKLPVSCAANDGLTAFPPRTPTTFFPFFLNFRPGGGRHASKKSGRKKPHAVPALRIFFFRIGAAGSWLHGGRSLPLWRKRRKIHRVTLFERYLHLHRISLCFSTLHHPAASTEKCPECLHGSTYPYARHRPAVFCFRFFKSCRDKKKSPRRFFISSGRFQVFLAWKTKD